MSIRRDREEVQTDDDGYVPVPGSDGVRIRLPGGLDLPPLGTPKPQSETDDAAEDEDARH